ncbi:MAG: sterol desaturase family protein [Myxococcales bacterium]|nr:sterol desaturase family protein [Myxococcales bacterium]MCB9569325.1 sterol desaturase family protein [Myxococcales bacterium]MCB9705922.1 sterol desaturase family protein [Myxococcales bacterium]
MKMKKKPRPLDPHSSRQDSDPSLLTVFLVFIRYSSPFLLILLTLSALVTRIWLGHFTGWDLLIPAAIVAAQPFVEWLIHVFILHFKPRTILGLKFDLHAARLHRAHHRAPWQLSLIFIPKLTGVIGLAITATLWWLATPTPYLFATAMLSTLGMALTYEWIHYLTHTNYRPQSAFYRRLWRYHRLHHFKNENYWMGVTGHLGDRVLGTLPRDPRDVETSETSRTLGVDDPTPA